LACKVPSNKGQLFQYGHALAHRQTYRKIEYWRTL
jgi:hypothetical protein